MDQVKNATDKRINACMVETFFSREGRRLDAIALERKLFIVETHHHSKFEHFDDDKLTIFFTWDYFDTKSLFYLNLNIIIKYNKTQRMIIRDLKVLGDTIFCLFLKIHNHQEI